MPKKSKYRTDSTREWEETKEDYGENPSVVVKTFQALSLNFIKAKINWHFNGVKEREEIYECGVIDCPFAVRLTIFVKPNNNFCIETSGNCKFKGRLIR